MKTVEKLITRVRRETRNATTGATTAGASIPDAEFVDALNDGQELCVEMISGVFSRYFEASTILTVDASATDPEEIDLPEDILLGTRVSSVEFSYDTESNYYNVRHVDIRERQSSTNSQRRIRSYARSGSKIILMQKPTQDGTLRVVYEQAPRRLDETKITVATASTISGDSTDITWTAGTEGDDVATWDIGDLVDVTDRSDGSLLARGATITAISAGAGTITLDLSTATSYVEATFNAATDTNLRIIENGRTNVSELPDSCEKYIVAYAVMLIFERDLSKLAKAAEKRFGRIADSLMKAYIQEDRDFPAIPETEY